MAGALEVMAVDESLPVNRGVVTREPSACVPELTAEVLVPRAWPLNNGKPPNVAFS